MSIFSSPDTKDAVCFTAGANQLLLSVGVAHAYWVEQRKPTHLVGVSLGAISAAKLREIFSCEGEARGSAISLWFSQALKFDSYVDAAWRDSWPLSAQDVEGVPKEDRKRARIRFVVRRALRNMNWNVKDFAVAAQNYRRERNAGLAPRWWSLRYFRKPFLALVKAMRGPYGHKVLQHIISAMRKTSLNDVLISDLALFERAAVRAQLASIFEESGELNRGDGPQLNVVLTSTSAGAPAQFVARNPTLDTLVHALTTPGLVIPDPAATVEIAKELNDEEGTRYNELWDGALFRPNPLPGFFDRYENENAPFNFRLVYSDPFEEHLGAATKPTMKNIVGVSWRASRRRDIELEWRQTWFTSQLVRRLANAGQDPAMIEAEISAIAPSHDVASQPQPERDILYAVQGCRHTLEALRADAILREQYGPGSQHTNLVPCPVKSGKRPSAVKAMCAHCPGTLRPPRQMSLGEVADQAGPGGAPQPDRSAVFRPTKSDTYADENVLKRLPRVVTEALKSAQHKPRVVLLAQGGVFRGSFQVGAMAALRLLNIIPDIIVGASIGAGIGAFAAKYLRDDDSSAHQTLSAVARAFVEVEQVAQTEQFESNLAEVWVRLRRHKVRLQLSRGAKYNARQLGILLPSIKASELEAVADAIIANNLSTAIKLSKRVFAGAIPDKPRSLMGPAGLNSLIEAVLGDLAQDFQPFVEHSARPIAHFATATRLQTEGSDCLGKFAIAGEEIVSLQKVMLASAAFPAVFDPQRIGAWTYFDGGVLDNLPVLPAIDLLASLQVHDFQLRTRGETAEPRLREETRAYFRERIESPHLLVGVCLDYEPTTSSTKSMAEKTTRRGNHAKIESIRKAVTRTRPLLESLAKEDSAAIDPSFNQYVCMDVKKVTPSKLNKTFAFERALNLDDETMNHSIVDGCFQTLQTFSGPESETIAATKSDACPFFRKADGASVSCPFSHIPGRGRWRKPMLRTVCVKENSGVACRKLKPVAPNEK